MARDAQQDPRQEPKVYPPGTLFVAVSDGDQTYAGYDGGPQRGGKGRWKVGEVGEWTSNIRPPMAKRNPDDGLIHIGYLEVVLTTARKENGSLECLTSEKIYEHPMTPEQRTQKVMGDANAEVQRRKSSEPSAKASDRAQHGGAAITDVLQPNKPKQGRPAKGSVAHALQGGDRASDRSVV